MLNNLNWKPSPKDPRDYKFKNLYKIQPRSNLPTEVNISKVVPSIYDQLDIGSCTANGGCQLVQFISTYQNRFVDPSRLFLYYITRDFEGTPNEDSGCYVRDVLKVLNKTGVCKEITYPYITDKIFNKPDEKCYKESLETVATSYHALDNTRLEELKTCLSLGKPFIFGFYVYSSFMYGNWSDTMPIPKRSEQLLGGHCVCLTPDNTIVTKKGIKTIDLIDKKDQVLTRKGFKSIIEISNREVNEDIYLIESPLTIRPLSLTKEHPIFTKSSKVSNKLKYENFKNFTFKRADEIKKYDLICSVINQTEIDNDDISFDFARLLGYYIGDGNLQIEYYKENIKSCKFRLSYHRECKKGIVEDIINIIEKEFPGTKYSIWENKNSLGNNIIFYNTELGKKILKYCGKAKEKTIDSLLELPKQKQLEILKGWFKTDGSGEWLEKSSIRTSEYNLAQSLIILLQRNNLIYSSSVIDAKITYIQNRKVNQKESYNITFHLPRKKNRIYYKDNMVYSRISSIKTQPYEGNVYNIHVKDQEEYIANNILVHNCAVGYSDTKKAFLIKNSWGENWKQKGYFWMPYSFITSSSYCDDFWTLESINDLTEPVKPVDTAIDISKVFESKNDLNRLGETFIVRIGQLLNLDVDMKYTKRRNLDIVAKCLGVV